VRADALDRLSAGGWEALRAYGIGTIVDLRNDHEIAAVGDAPTYSSGLTSVRVPLDDIADTDFWQHCRDHELDGSPLYYRPFLDRKPERCAAALTAIARAGPGGIVFHCGGGRDRTGLVSLLLLALAGVEAGQIAADYERSNVRLRAYWASRGEPDESREIARILTRRRTTARALVLEVLESLDAESYLRAAGVEESELAAVRERLLGPRIA
jgi:protein-tyrosine phosphatase